MCLKKPLIWCRSLYNIMKLANIAMLGCMFVTYTDICKHIMFTVQANHHGISVRFHFYVRPKPLCNPISCNPRAHCSHGDFVCLFTLLKYKAIIEGRKFTAVKSLWTDIISRFHVIL